jgi:hypothetical protein
MNTDEHGLFQLSVFQLSAFFQQLSILTFQVSSVSAALLTKTGRKPELPRIPVRFPYTDTGTFKAETRVKPLTAD